MTVRTAGTPIPIPQIQGRGAISPLNGKSVVTQGVVTAVQKSERYPGVYLQDPKGDGDVATSDGIFVSTAKMAADARAKLAPGQMLQVSGRVTEERDVTTILAGEKSIKGIGRSIARAELPAPTVLELPASKAQAKTYLEAREGMVATINNALAIGPTSKYQSFVVVDEKNHGPQRDFDNSAAGKRIAISSRIGPKTQIVTGDRIEGITGPITYRWDDYELLQTRYYKEVKRGPYPPKMWGDIDGDDRITKRDVSTIRSMAGKPAHGPLDPADLNGDGKITVTDARQAQQRAARVKDGPSFRVATMNALNFFDDSDAPPPIDDPVVSRNQLNAKLARLAGTIKDQMTAPDVLALQEVENTQLLKQLIERPELKAFNYKYELLQTPGHRNINIALLYRGDSVDVSNVRQAQKHVKVDQAPSLTMKDANSDGTAPLFSRPPLLADVTVKNGDQQQEFTIVANHLISKFSPHGLPTEPIRVEQAKFINSVVRDLAKAGREAVVVGDMNDRHDSKSLRAMEGPKSDKTLVNVGAELTPKGERYTFNYNGHSEMIDHILATPKLAAQTQLAGVRHFNSDVPDSAQWGTAPFGASDHDSPYAVFSFPSAPAAGAKAGAEALAAAPKKQ